MEEKMSLVTVCRGRLSYLKTAIESWLCCPIVKEIIVVDCRCPDHVADWVREYLPAVRVVDDRGEDFNLPRAHNTGARFARAKWLFFCDSDIVLRPSFSDSVGRQLRSGAFLTVEKRETVLVPGLGGLLICARSDFNALEGYDELFDGWGGDDSDMIERLLQLRRSRGSVPWAAIKHIDHPEALRHANYPGLEPKAASDHNRRYVIAKGVYMHLARSTIISLEERKKIREFTRLSE